MYLISWTSPRINHLKDLCNLEEIQLGSQVNGVHSQTVSGSEALMIHN